MPIDEVWVYRLLFVCLCVCVRICFFVPYARPQFPADLHEIWHAAFLCPLDGHGWGMGG